jgi:pheromone shutdown protein TraB
MNSQVVMLLVCVVYVCIRCVGSVNDFLLDTPAFWGLSSKVLSTSGAMVAENAVRGVVCL